MAIVPILTVPNEVLYEKSHQVKSIDPTVEEVVQNLLDTLDNAKEPGGAGLSAPQIGILERIIVARKFKDDLKNPENSSYEDYVLINPAVTKFSKEKDIAFEGCLSVPNIYGKVERPKKIKIEATDENGELVKIQASGFFAKIIQHEIDHLNGIIFTDKVIGETVTGDELDTIYVA